MVTKFLGFWRQSIPDLFLVCLTGLDYSNKNDTLWAWPSPRFCSPIMKVKALVPQSCLTLCNPMDCSLPGSSVYGILQARILEWDCRGHQKGKTEVA